MKTSFDKAFQRFLTAVSTRDRGSFEEFLSPDTDFFAILPDGTRCETVAAFRQTQDAWFNGNTGTFLATLKNSRVEGSLAFASIEATYRNVDAEGKNFKAQIYISFIFEHRDERWFLIHDQNTLVSREIETQ